MVLWTTHSFQETQQVRGQVVGDGYPKLAVVKGAGIVLEDNDGVREVVIGEKYITRWNPSRRS